MDETESEPLLSTASRDSEDRQKLDITTNIPLVAQSTPSHASPTPVTHLTHQLSFSSDAGFNENFANLNAEYLKRRYRKRHENPEKINQLLAEYTRILGNLSTALEGKMDVAVSGLLQEILVSLDSNIESSASKAGIDSGDRQRALFKSNICTLLSMVLKEMGGDPLVCEKALLCVAYLCRHSDENKNSTCLENAKGFGLAGVSDIIVGAIKLHKDSKAVFEAACDAIRSLCALESNRGRLGNAGACEATARGLVAHANDPVMIGWICRAIGHLAANHDENRERLGHAGACESLVNVLQKYPMNMNVCIEACWAIRQLAFLEDNRSRFANDFGPESLMAVYKHHFNQEVFACEATQALVRLVGPDEDDVSSRIENSGFVAMAMKSLKKNPDSEVLARWVFNMLYYIAIDGRFTSKLLKTEVLDLLSLSFESHASYEGMAEWGCRFVHVLASDENAMGRMRSAGMCEMVTSAVQRQSISKVVSSVGCIAIGDLAKEDANQERLSSAGACEAVVQALKRHNSQVDVCYNSCYAIHYLCKTQNNIAWMGASGGCEAVTSALIKHHENSEDVAVFASMAMASLAYKDAGNQHRFFTAHACKAITDTLRVHIKHPEVAENACRAIYNLSFDKGNVKDLGGNDACGLVVSTLQEHAGRSNVVAQALFAVSGLAVKSSEDRVHKGNTRKLVEKGAIEIVINVMQKFADREDVQRGAGMAIASLARLEANRNRFGKAGACELVSNSIQLHLASAAVIAKLASAVDTLCANSDLHRGKFGALKTVENLVFALQRHEKNASLVIECLKALVNLAHTESNRSKIFTEQSIPHYVKLLKIHEKNGQVAWWGCALVSSAAHGKENLGILGKARACENVINVLARHGEASDQVAQWGCNCVVALSLSDENKERFFNLESCQAIVKALGAHYQNTLVAQFGAASIAALAVFQQNRKRLAQAKASLALCNTLSYQNANEIIIRFTCEAISEICTDEKENQVMLKTDGICDIIVNLYTQHREQASITSDLLKALSAVAKAQPEIGTKFIDLGIAEYIHQGISQHGSQSVAYAEYACSAIASIVGKVTKYQMIFLQLNTIEAIYDYILINHKEQKKVMIQVMRALRILASGNKDCQQRISKHEQLLLGIIGVVSIHVLTPTIVEHGCWLLGSIEYRAATNRERMKSASTSDLQNLLTSSPTANSNNNDETSSTRSNDNTSNAENTPTDDSTRSHAASTATVPSQTFYANATYWDVLYSALRSHHNRPSPFACICMAITMFSNKGKLPHMMICTFLIETLEKHVDDDIQLFRILETIGSLARNHPTNNQKLTDENVCEIIDSIISGHQEGSVAIQGVFQAIAGLSENNPVNKDTFHALPNTSMNLANILYHELETDAISQYGCLAVYSLVKNHPKNQLKFTSVCNFIADVLMYHKLQPAICMEACRAISYLAHKNFMNRNRLGTSDACSAIMMVITPCFEEQLNASWRKYDTTLLYWVVKAIGDLAANNPNNQTKLGNHGACELLVRTLDRKHMEGQRLQEAKVIANVLWAIGNLVQFGKGSSMIIQDQTEVTVPPAASTASTLATDPINLVFGDASTRNSNTTSNRNAAGQLNILSQTKMTKNTTRFANVQIAEKMKKVIYDFIEYPEVMLWSSRALNNLAKSQKLRRELLDVGIMDGLQGIIQKYTHVTKNNEILEWANLAKESLNA